MGRLGALGGGAGGVLAAHVGLAPAGAARVHLEALEVVGEGDGEHVEGRLGGLVGGRGHAAGLGNAAERAELAGDVDDARGVGLAEHGQGGAGEGEDADDVGLERLAQDGGAQLAGLHAPVEEDAGVIDEDVEAAQVLLDEREGGGDGVGDGDVEADGRGFQPLARELGGGFLTLLGVACTHHDVDAQLAELAGDLEADALVGAGDEGDACGCGHGRSSGVCSPARANAAESRGVCSSGAEENRTPDLIIANDALYQLSYRPRAARRRAGVRPGRARKGRIVAVLCPWAKAAGRAGEHAR